MSRYLTLGIVTFLLASLGVAQTQSGTYRLQVEDRIGIAVFDEPQLSAAVTVLPDGNITAPFAGLMRAEGKTTSEIESELADIYTSKLKLKNPKVTVTVITIRRILASIGGSVEHPGQFELRQGMTVRDLVNQGGARDELGNLRHATFRRKNWDESIPLDLYSMIVFGNMAQNYEIQDGDAISVPPKKNQIIRVFGEVNRPTNLQYDDDMDLISALDIAGGPIPGRAKKSRVLVVRPRPGNPDSYYMIECNLVAYEKKQDYAQNIKLLPGDTIIVGNNGNVSFDVFNSFANALFVLDRFGIRIGNIGN